jgi:hypothetical protein
MNRGGSKPGAPRRDFGARDVDHDRREMTAA